MAARVAHINLARGYRGGERQTELLVRRLAGADLAQVLVARAGSPLTERLADADVEIRPVSGSLLSALRATGGVDLVHAHEGRGVYAAWLRSLISGTPYVITRRVNNPLGSGPVTRMAYRRAACVASVAQHVADVVSRYDNRINSVIVHSGSSGLIADPAVVASIRARFPGKWLVGHVGALDNRQKGQDGIIAVARRLADSHPDIQFVLVGGGADEAMLRDLAAGLDNLVFTGFVDNVGDYLAAFDLFILPSNKEGIAGILIDVMEQRRPIIAADVGGVSEVLGEDGPGLLIEAGRPDQLQEAILRLHGDPVLCRQLGERGTDRAQNFSADVMTGKYLNLYRAALGSSKIP